MASVYLARPQLGLGRTSMVAVKIIHAHLASDAEFVEMFMDEAELASQIRHANVCSVLDYASDDGEYFIAMEYLLGESLMSVWNRISRRTQVDRLHVARCVARVLSDACEGLHAAHQLTDVNDESLEIVHRDVSPENVFVTYDGVAKVMDFGVASAARKRHKTQTGIIKGKFAYVAPECLRGAKADRRADVWGIGVIAWELLTGKRLFRRDSDLDTLHAVSDDPIPRPSQAQPELPTEIDEIVMRALARDPTERYASARELGRELARFAARGDDVVTSADVADWLEQLFPGGKARRRQILELARLVDGDENDVTRLVSKRRPERASSAQRRRVPLGELAPEPAPEPAPVPTTVWTGRAPVPSVAPETGAASHEPRAGRMRTFGRAALLIAFGFACGGTASHAWPSTAARVPASAGTKAAAEALGRSSASPRATAAAQDGEIWLRIRVEPETRAAQPPPLVYVAPAP